MGEFGSEFVNVENTLPDRDRRDQSAAVQFSLLSYVSSSYDGVSSSTPSYLYFAPGQYVIRPEGLPTVRIGNGPPYSALIFPKQHTLWFARNAYLDLRPGVMLIIRGQIRADPTRIFALPDVVALGRAGVSAPPADSAIVRIESEAIEEIYPQWFGALSVDGASYRSHVNGAPTTRALQACFNAACRDRTRDGRSLPPLTVVCTGIVCTTEPVDALPDPNGRGALWLRGDNDASSDNLGIAAINRFPKALLDPGRREGDRASLLRVDPRVSVDVEGVGFKTILGFPPNLDEREVAQTILIEEASDASVVPWRHAYFERCGVTGGRLALVTLEVRESTSLMDEIGRIAGSADQGTATGSSGTATTVTGAATDRRDIPTRRRVRSATQYAFRNFVMDAFYGGVGEGRSAAHVLRASLPQHAQIDLTAGKLFQSTNRFSDRVDLRAGLRLNGTSTLLRTLSFHLGEGPRPSIARGSRSHPVYAPDGQDIWLDADTAHSPHLTVLHADSQSWWFLGAAAPLNGVGAVTLLNVGANDVNLNAWLANHAGQSGIGQDYGEARRLFLPPSLHWPGGSVPLLLESCTFYRYATRVPEGRAPVSIGTSFRVGDLASDRARREEMQGLPAVAFPPVTWLPPSAIPDPSDPSFETWRGGGVFSGRLIPPDWVSGNRSLYPEELGVLAERSW